MRHWLIGDLGVKLGAVLLAAALWFHAVTEHSYQRQFDIPLAVQNPATPPGEAPIVLATQPPRTVRVAVFGGGKDLLRSSGSDFLLRVATPTGEPGTRLSVRLRPEQVESHSEFELSVEEVVAPRELALLLDRRGERRVRVRPRVGLSLSESYTQVGAIRIEPDSVRITGPLAQVAGVSAIDTDSLFSSDVHEDVDRELRLIAPEGYLVRLDHDRVRVTIDIQELAEYEILNVPVRVRGGPKGAVTEPSRVTVRVRGGADLIGSLDAETDLPLFVDYPTAGETEAVPIEVGTARLFEIRQIIPAQAAVVVR